MLVKICGRKFIDFPVRVGFTLSLSFKRGAIGENGQGKFLNVSIIQLFW